jgi:hypothetical protein
MAPIALSQLPVTPIFSEKLLKDSNATSTGKEVFVYEKPYANPTI